MGKSTRQTIIDHHVTQIEELQHERNASARRVNDLEKLLMDTQQAWKADSDLLRQENQVTRKVCTWIIGHLLDRDKPKDK